MSRMTSPRLIILTAGALLACTTLRAQSAPGDVVPPATPEAKEAISQDTKAAREALEGGDTELAEKLYNQLLTVDSPDTEKKGALLEMFDLYRERCVYSKAIAVGERFRQMFPDDAKTPELLLKLGQLYRETGAYQLAISRFYTVLNQALRINPDEFTKYQAFSTKAQFEIAETFMTSGDYAQASRTYTMLDRLDLSHADKAHEQFQVTYCNFLMTNYPDAVTSARKFLESYADTEYSPQCHYLLSVALKAVHKPQEASEETLTLLRIAKKAASNDKDSWVYWQKKTGNQIANAFYQERDYTRALAIYQGMAKLSNDADWQLPVIYQVGLCFERLQMPDRAKEAYHFIGEETKKITDAGKEPSDDLAELNKMADWRTQHIGWEETTTTELNDLLGDRPVTDDPKLPDDPRVTQAH